MIKLNIIKFLLFLYKEHIEEDFNIYNKIGKICIYPLWVIKNIMVVFFLPLFILEYIWKNTKLYKTIHFIEKEVGNEIMFLHYLNKKIKKYG